MLTRITVFAVAVLVLATSAGAPAFTLPGPLQFLRADFRVKEIHAYMLGGRLHVEALVKNRGNMTVVGKLDLEASVQIGTQDEDLASSQWVTIAPGDDAWCLVGSFTPDSLPTHITVSVTADPHGLSFWGDYLEFDETDNTRTRTLTRGQGIFGPDYSE